MKFTKPKVERTLPIFDGTEVPVLNKKDLEDLRREIFEVLWEKLLSMVNSKGDNWNRYGIYNSYSHFLTQLGASYFGHADDFRVPRRVKLTNRHKEEYFLILKTKRQPKQTSHCCGLREFSAPVSVHYELNNCSISNLVDAFLTVTAFLKSFGTIMLIASLSGGQLQSLRFLRDRVGFAVLGNWVTSPVYAHNSRIVFVAAAIEGGQKTRKVTEV